MFKIKKCVYKVMTMVLALLVVLNTSAIGVLADSVNPDEVTPKPEDYEIAQNSDGGVTITGLKKDYLGGLSTEQKQNIRLVIPEKIGEKEVTAIGNNAFSYTYNTGCGFVYLDISQASHLKSIGTHSFDGASQLRQNLELPENVETIDAYAFNNCGFTGELRIPAKVKVIGESAFRQSNSYNGFSGTLKIPASVKSIGKVAFSNQRCITGVDLSVCTLDSLGTSVFKGTGLQGSLCIPNTIKTIGDGAFKDTFLETIYLPNDIMVENNSFDSCSKLNAIICNQSDYKILSDKLSTSSKAKLGYPITVDFDDGNGGVYKSRECLYNLPYNYERDSNGIWKPNNDYVFPSVIKDKNMTWAIDKTSVKPVNETDKVNGETLYAINKLENPVITYGEGIDNTYDGKLNTLKVTATHRLYKDAESAGAGDVVIWYDWYWGTIGYSNPVLKGYDENQYTFEDVRQPDFAITCGVKIRAFVVDAEGHIEEFYSESHDFPVYLRQAEPSVHPTVISGIYKMSEGQTDLPEINLSAGDTAGTISWDVGQQLEEGFGTYTWTFTPNPNGINNNKISNYKEVKGQVELYATTEEINHESLENKIEEVPVITEEKPPTEDEKEKIFDAFFAYESSDDSIKANISKDVKEKIFETINKLPQVCTGTEGLQVGNEKDLVKNLSTRDAATIKNDDNANCTIKIVSKERATSTDVQEAVNSVAGNESKIGASFDVEVMKTLESNGATIKTNTLKTVAEPLKLVFDVPKSLQSESRKFFIVRFHSDEDGTTTSEKLDDEDNNPATITVTSDKFSTYTIVYTEEKSSDSNSGGISNIYNIVASAGEHGSITPSGSAYAYYGSSKTYEFTPEEGYQVSDVIVDGVSVGPMLSYTFEKITKAHTIEVVFQAVADDQDRIINGIKNTTIKASSSVKKGAITIKWKKSAGFKVDYYQVFRSKKKNTGYGTKPFYSTKTSVQKSYKNTKNLKKGTRYYYKVRGVRTIDGKKVFTKWSNKTWRIAK